MDICVTEIDFRRQGLIMTKLKLIIHKFQNSCYFETDHVCFVEKDSVKTESTKVFKTFADRLDKTIKSFQRQWAMKDGSQIRLSTMTNQHVENSLRYFFEQSDWSSVNSKRKKVLKLMVLERNFRIKKNKYSLLSAKLGRFGEHGKRCEEKFLKEMINI